MSWQQIDRSKQRGNEWKGKGKNKKVPLKEVGPPAPGSCPPFSGAEQPQNKSSINAPLSLFFVLFCCFFPIFPQLFKFSLKKKQQQQNTTASKPNFLFSA